MCVPLSLLIPPLYKVNDIANYCQIDKTRLTTVRMSTVLNLQIYFYSYADKM